MEIALQYLLVCCSCATAGWLLEVVYRAFRHHKVVNPGFLTGCCLPIYGIGGGILYFLSGLKLRIMPNEALRVATILLLAALIMTLIELVGGLIAVKYFRVRLWDYSEEWGNFKGVICPKFSLIWGAIGAGYYFFIYPFVHDIAIRTIERPWLILCIGAYLGVFGVDLAHSFRLMQRLRNYARTMRTHLSLDQIKISAREHFKQETGKRHPLFNFHKMVGNYLSDLHGYREQIHERWGNKK